MANYRSRTEAQAIRRQYLPAGSTFLESPRSRLVSRIAPDVGDLALVNRAITKAYSQRAVDFDRDIASELANLGYKLFWFDQDVRLAIVDQGIALVPNVADCLGIIARSNLGMICAGHFSIDTGYGDEDILNAIAPHAESHHGAKAKTVRVYLTGNEINPDIELARQAQVSNKIKLESAIAKRLGDVRLEQLVYQLRTRGQKNWAMHSTWASTCQDKRESGIGHCSQTFVESWL